VNQITKLLPIYYQRYRGFSLIEMLVASIATVILITAVGYVLTHTLQNRKNNAMGVERRTEINRALEFISNEIKSSEKIETNTSPSNLTTIAPSFSPPGGANAILALKVPNLDRPIIYYVADKNPGTAWQGPKIIYRWGPTLDINGAYSNTTWEHHPLIDRVDNNNLNPNCNGSVTNLIGTGFAACVNNSGKIAQIFIRGKFANTFYLEQTKAYARVNNSPPPVANNQIDLASVTLAQTPNCSVSSGSLNCNSPVTLTFQNLGGALTCGVGGQTMNVTTTLNITYSDSSTASLNLAPANIDSNGNTIAPGSPLVENPTVRNITQVTVDSMATTGDWCSYYSYNAPSTNTAQVQALRNGDPVPNITPFANQATIDTFLQGYVENGQIKLASNQVIYLFELGTEDQTDSSYDLQDNVVLVTISPTI
jgi:hypothetical protein